jgi:hypothetical protein
MKTMNKKMSFALAVTIIGTSLIGIAESVSGSLLIWIVPTI